MPAEPLTGRILGGKYRLLRRLGEGGMGTVYEAVHRELEKRVAVKLLHLQMAPHQEVYQRFRREARIACKLHHPNIIEVHDFDHTEDNIPYIVMELLEGQDLETLIHRERALPAARVLELLDGVFSGVGHAHAMGVVHRDLKPQNIFLCRFGDRADFPKVLDFGISKLKDNQSMLTQDKAYLGTPCFMAPEQARGRAVEAEVCSDIFSLGAILYRMLSGQLPFMGKTVEAVLYQVVHEDPMPLHELEPSVPPALSSVVHQALAKAPEERFQTVSALVAALKEAQAHPHGAPASRPSPSKPELQVVNTWGMAEQPGVVPLVHPKARAPSPPVVVPPPAVPPGVLLDSAPPAPEARGDARTGPLPVQPARGMSTLTSSTGEQVHRLSNPWSWPLRLGLAAAAAAVLALGILLGARWLGNPGVPSGGPPLSQPAPGAGEAATRGSPDPHAAAPDPAASPEPSRAQAIPPDAAPAAAPQRVKVELQGVPEGAEVLLDGQTVAQGPLLLERSTERRRLQVNAAGGAQFETELVPQHDLTIQVKMSRPRPGSSPRPRPRGSAEPTVRLPEPAGPAPVEGSHALEPVAPGPAARDNLGPLPGDKPGKKPELKEYDESTMPFGE